MRRMGANLTRDENLRRGLQKALDAAGNANRLALALGITRASIYRWKCIPAERVVDVEKALGIPRKQLRPDLYE